MKHDQLVEAVDKIRHSSAFTPGDPTTFKIPLLKDEVELPGPCDPYAYLALAKAKLGLTDFAKEHRVAIIGAGLGGLSAAALDLGVAEVISIEPRPRFRSGLDAVTGLLNQIHLGTDQHKTRCFYGWPAEGHKESLGDFDLIIWPECFEESVLPVEALAVALWLLKPGGQLVIEVKHGQNSNIPAGRINSWLPTTEAFEKLVVQVNGKGVVASVQGRDANRNIYIIEAHDPKVPEIAPPVSTLPPFPRDPKAPLPVAEKPAASAALPSFPRDPAPKTAYRSASSALPALGPATVVEDDIPADPIIITEEPVLDLPDAPGPTPVNPIVEDDPPGRRTRTGRTVKPKSE